MNGGWRGLEQRETPAVVHSGASLRSSPGHPECDFDSAADPSVRHSTAERSLPGRHAIPAYRPFCSQWET